MAAPGQRKPGSTGGSGHRGSRTTSIKRGGSPSLGKAGSGSKPPSKGVCCTNIPTITLIIVVGLLLAPIGIAIRAGQWVKKMIIRTPAMQH